MKYWFYGLFFSASLRAFSAGVRRVPRPPTSPTARQACSCRSFSRDTKAPSQVPSPDFQEPFPGSPLRKFAHHSLEDAHGGIVLCRAPDLFLLAPPNCEQRAAQDCPVVARSRIGLLDISNCNNNNIPIVGAPSHSIMPSRCCRLPCRLNSRCPSETAGPGCPLLHQFPLATRATSTLTMVWLNAQTT